ncbi:hypothetical protein ACJA25_00955 [Mycoplasmopsis hyopharyngis]|uniref:hypothetical protein n=1 Tax=Mycoplasmopsis hyopharyngis TaxID=29558 RepID=UPI0038733036
MKFKKQLSKFIIFSTLTFSSVFSYSCSCNQKYIQQQKINLQKINSIKNPLGVWQWRIENITIDSINFLVQNNIKEIYLKVNEIGQKEKNILQSLKQKGIKIYFLLGNKNFLLDDTKLITKINDYISFNQKEKLFEGIHLDIEPHQFNQEWKVLEKRKELILKFLNLIKKLKNQFPLINFEYDIPFWFKDQITFDNKTKLLYEHIIDMANRTFFMLYRKQGIKIISLSKQIIEYAKQKDKQIFICVETSKTDEENISFYESDKTTMVDELLVIAQNIPSHFGIAIHHLEAFEKLKEVK